MYTRTCVDEELKMVTCPKCKAENRTEAAFCSRCGTILFAQPVAAKAVEQSKEVKAVISPVATKPVDQSSATQVVVEGLPEVIEP